MTARATATAGTLHARLDPAMVYRSPTGRLCVVREVDYHKPLVRNGAAVAHLEYVRPDGRAVPSHMADGFSLSRENWPRLQAVARRPEVG